MHPSDPHHIAPEDLELLALGRLPAAERARAELHLAECPLCRTALDEESRIAAGVRSSGRTEMKRHLATRIAESGRTATPWPKILSIAAVVVILAGVGLVYRMLTTQEPAPQITERSIPPPELTGKPAQTMQKEPERPDAPVRNREPAESRRPAFTDAISKDKKAETGRRLKESEGNLSSGAGGPVSEPVAKAEASAAQSSEWLVGTLLIDERADLAAQQPQLQSRETATQRAAGAQMQHRDVAAVKFSSRPLPIVHLRPLSEFQKEAGSGLSTAGEPGLPTLVKQSADSIVFTIYTDVFTPRIQLGEARLLQSGPDSILLIVGGRSISYRMNLQLTR